MKTKILIACVLALGITPTFAWSYSTTTSGSVNGKSYYRTTTTSGNGYRGGCGNGYRGGCGWGAGYGYGGGYYGGYYGSYAGAIPIASYAYPAYTPVVASPPTGICITLFGMNICGINSTPMQGVQAAPPPPQQYQQQQ